MMKERRELFQKARSYALYYGKSEAGKLAHYDMVIVEPGAQSAKNIQALHAMKTLVFAYVSIMEIGPLHTLYPMLKEEDFLQVKGNKICKEGYDTYVLNLKSKRWLGLLYHHIGNLLLHQGYDGIFMDTIGNAEDPIIPLIEKKAQITKATELVRNLRRLFPNHVLIQNNGLEYLCSQTGEYLDGLCWENPLFAYADSQEWCRKILERIVGLKRKYGVRTLFLHNESQIRMTPSAGIRAQAIADKYAFLYYTAGDHYLALP